MNTLSEVATIDTALRDVGVVIVHWGDAACTQRAVRDVCDGTGLPSRQLFVVENGASSGVTSSEATLVSLPENVGYAAAVNRGMEGATASGARYVAVMNNDLRYRAGTLERMRYFLQSRRLGCVGAVLDEGDAEKVYGGGTVSWWRGRALAASSLGMARHLDYISGAFFLLSVACFRDVGGLPEHYFLYWEDVAYGFRLRKQGWSIGCADTPPLSHPRSSSMENPQVKTYYLVRNGALFVREYAPLQARRRLLAMEQARLAWAALRGRWEIVHALRDARRGFSGPLPDRAVLSRRPS